MSELHEKLAALGVNCLFCKTRIPATAETCDTCAHEVVLHLLDACVTSWVPSDGKTPRQLLSSLQQTDQAMALDPLISEEARQLQLDERNKIVAWLRHGVEHLGWHDTFLVAADAIERGEHADA